MSKLAGSIKSTNIAVLRQPQLKLQLQSHEGDYGFEKACND